MALQMDKGEIVASYRDAKNKEQQIGILAELNACKKCEIEDVLVRAGFEIPFRKKERKHRAAATQWTPERVAELEGYLREKLTYLEIAERMGVSKTAISYQVSSRGLASLSKSRKKEQCAQAGNEDMAQEKLTCLVPCGYEGRASKEVQIDEVYVKHIEDELRIAEEALMSAKEDNKILLERLAERDGEAEMDVRSVKGLAHIVLCSLKKLAAGVSEFDKEILDGAIVGVAHIVMELQEFEQRKKPVPRGCI